MLLPMIRFYIVTFTGDRFVFYDCAENKDGKVIYIMKMSVEDTPPPSWNLYEEIDYGNNKGKCE